MKLPTNFIDEIEHFDFIKDIEKELSLPTHFFHKLIEEDDWSFVIKTHALIDAAITKLLTDSLGKDEISENVSRLNFSTRLGFAKSLNLLTDSRKFIEKLNDIRNRFVHNVTNINANITKFINSSEKKKEFLTTFRWGYSKIEEVVKEKEDYTIENLLKLFAFIFADIEVKFSIWFGSMLVLREAHSSISRSKFEKEMNVLDRKILKLIEELTGNQNLSDI